MGDTNRRILPTSKLHFNLDHLTRDTGALRVIPGSHLFGDGYADRLQEEIRESEADWGVHGKDIPAIAFETQPGDVVCFNHNTKHAAFGGGTRRRMFTMNLCERYPEDRFGGSTHLHRQLGAVLD